MDTYRVLRRQADQSWFSSALGIGLTANELSGGGEESGAGMWPENGCLDVGVHGMAVGGWIRREGQWVGLMQEGAQVVQARRKWLLLPLLKIPSSCKDLVAIVDASSVTIRSGGNRGVVTATGTVREGAAVPEEDVVDAF